MASLILPVHLCTLRSVLRVVSMIIASYMGIVIMKRLRLAELSFFGVICLLYLQGMLHCVEGGAANLEEAPRGTEAWIQGAFERKPVNAAVPFLPFTWARYAESRRLDQVVDILKDNVDPAVGAFIIYGGGKDYRKLTSILKKLGITHAFSPEGTFNKSMNGVRIAPVLFAPRVIVRPAPEKDLLYSFVGAATSRTRRTMLDAIQPVSNDVVIIRRSCYHARVRPHLRVK